MSEVSIISPPAIYGEAVAGESAQVRTQLESLINSVDKSAFDIAELLYKTKSKGYYTAWGFSTFQEYYKTLKIKERKAQYLTKMAETFEKVGIPRSKYEPLGVARCREITSLDPAAIYTNPETKAETPVKEFITAFVEKGDEIEMDLLKQHVRTLKGMVGDSDIVPRTLHFQRSVAENTWDKAIDLVRLNIGTVAKDADGMSQDASNERCAELMAADVLSNPSYQPQAEGA